MGFPYTAGDWTVSKQYVDSVAATKNIAIPDLSFASDYVIVSDEPNEVVIANKTGADLISHETIRFARSEVANIYQGVQTDSALVLPYKKGVQVMAEIQTSYKAVNGTSKAEYDVPVKGRIVLRVPTFGAVTDDMVADLVVRTISAAYATGSVNISRVTDLILGKLKP